MKSPNKLALILLCGVLAVNSVVAMDEVANIGFDFSDVVKQAAAEIPAAEVVTEVAADVAKEVVAEAATEAAKTGWMQSARQLGTSMVNGFASFASSAANSTAGQWVKEHPYMTAGAAVGAVGATGLGIYGARRYMQSRNTVADEQEAAEPAVGAVVNVETGEQLERVEQPSLLSRVIPGRKTVALGVGAVAASAASWYTGYTPAYVWNNFVPSQEAVRGSLFGLYNALPSKEVITTTTGNVMSCALDTIREQAAPVFAAESTVASAAAFAVARKFAKSEDDAEVLMSNEAVVKDASRVKEELAATIKDVEEEIIPVSDDASSFMVNFAAQSAVVKDAPRVKEELVATIEDAEEEEIIPVSDDAEVLISAEDASSFRVNFAAQSAVVKDAPRVKEKLFATIEDAEVLIDEEDAKAENAEVADNASDDLDGLAVEIAREFLAELEAEQTFEQQETTRRSPYSYTAEELKAQQEATRRSPYSYNAEQLKARQEATRRSPYSYNAEQLKARQEATKRSLYSYNAEQLKAMSRSK